MNKREKCVIIVLLTAVLIVLCMVAIQMKDNKKVKQQDVTKTVEDHKIESKEDNSQYMGATIPQEIQQYLQENGVDNEDVAYCITDLKHNIKYSMNESQEFIAASTYKLPLAMIYYDGISDGTYSLDSTFRYDASMHEGAGRISSNYSFGSQVPLKELLDCMILYSDNDAAHILYENLGGWTAYKEKMTKYTDSISENYYTDDNITTANTMNDVVSYLYAHEDIYNDLIENMKKAEPGNYLDKNIMKQMPQKYGNYEYACNSVGFVESSTPYSIVVLTDIGDRGIDVMAKINSIVYDKFK